MKVADLLEILNITKQSLGRVLKQLVEQGTCCKRKASRIAVASAVCDAERRGPGAQLATLQTQADQSRVQRTRRPMRMKWRAGSSRRLIDADNRDDVLRLIGRAERASRIEAELTGGASAMTCLQHFPMTRRICWWSTMTAASAICSRGLSAARAIASPRQRPRRLRARSSLASASIYSSLMS